MSEHFIERCQICGDIISQCRCPSKEKSVRWTTCEECQKGSKFVHALKRGKG